MILGGAPQARSLSLGETSQKRFEGAARNWLEYKGVSRKRPIGRVGMEDLSRRSLTKKEGGKYTRRGSRNS